MMLTARCASSYFVKNTVGLKRKRLSVALPLHAEFVVGRELRIDRARQLRHHQAAGAGLVVVAAGLVAPRDGPVREQVVGELVRTDDAPARLRPLLRQVLESRGVLVDDDAARILVEVAGLQRVVEVLPRQAAVDAVVVVEDVEADLRAARP